MSKVGTVTITIEPHIIEATMYVVKDPKPKTQPVPQQQPQHRPILQYGPPNGSMPPPLAPPASAAGTPTQNRAAAAKSTPQSPSQGPAQSPAQSSQTLTRTSQGQIATSTTAPPVNTATPSPSPSLQPRPQIGGPVAPSPTPSISQASPNISAPVAPMSASGPTVAPAAPTGPMAAPSMSPAPRPPPNSHPPAMQYFATEVRTILDIVLASNPNQKSSELRPPQGSDPLVVLLVKTALEDQRTRDMIRRIAENRPGFTDATDLKEILDRLHRDMKTAPRASPAPVQIRQQTPNGILNGQQKAPHNGPPPNPQALRSKGPPPAPKPDITAVVFDFGSGDRYLFPKFSILEYLPTTTGQQVVASFLIVRKGSTSEYGGDPKLDYYQPVTIRLFTPSGRHLENLARVVAPQDEVRRYMDDVMDHMTRAEYVLLAMRLPKASSDGEKDGTASEEPRTNGSTPKPDSAIEPKPTAKVGVLWTSKGNSETPPVEGRLSKPARYAEQEAEARYQRLINQVSAKDNEA
ncbi:hypothetical protein FoTM2_007411 [Fusarium oxysporum f. sp. vasinfectum]|nr:hypothetical protein FoTM2_007411 [Fusarium oxysporum f. sp. vasinfectum]